MSTKAFQDAHDFVLPPQKPEAEDYVSTEIPDIDLDEKTEFSFLEFLRDKRIEFYNKCHSPEGPQGGQFCSDNLDLDFSPADDSFPALSKKLKKISSLLNNVHDLPANFPKATVQIYENIGATDGTYDAGFDVISLSEENTTRNQNLEITFVHEFGHHVSLAEEGNYSLNQFLDKTDRISTLKTWKEALYRSDTYSGLKERNDKSPDPYDEYLLDEREAFARTYAQWITLRSGNKTLAKQLDAMYSDNVNFRWGDKEFEPIAEALDEHFKTSKRR